MDSIAVVAFVVAAVAASVAVAVVTAVSVRRSVRRWRHAARLEALDNVRHRVDRDPSALRTVLDGLDDTASHAASETASETVSELDLPPLEPGIGLREVLDDITRPAPEPRPTDE